MRDSREAASQTATVGSKQVLLEAHWERSSKVPGMKRHTLLVWMSILAVAMLAAAPTMAQHPYPQPRPGPSVQWTEGDTTYVVTPEGQFLSQNPFTDPPGSNMLLTDYRNMFDSFGVEMPNTLPSHPDNPWNLHDGPVLEEPIDPTSPSDALRDAFKTIRRRAEDDEVVDLGVIQLGLDIIEGNPLPLFVWSGFPLLHYTGPEKVKAVTPIYDGDTLVGGNLDIHQIWYDSHIESDTSFIDPRPVAGVPWTITYTIDCLSRCHDDFSPFVVYFDDPALTSPNPPVPHVAMDQTFFPMKDGKRYTFKLKMTRGKYYNLTYTWGWRVHPPRVQVSENANKIAAGKTLVQWEIDTFGPAPRSSRAAQLTAIAKIGDLSPAKRMWAALNEAAVSPASQVVGLMDDALDAFHDWFDRTELPAGADQMEDPDADLTMLYVNNTLYGKIKGGGWDTWSDWQTRPQVFKVTLLNGDHFPHGYVSADFGGSRGWENQFEPTIDDDGIGCKFSFGRAHWWLSAGGPWGAIIVPPVNPSDPLLVGRHKVEITFNYEPSRRLRLYQFDPLHHDVAVYSLH